MKIFLLNLLIIACLCTDFCSKSIIVRDISLPVPLKRQYLIDIEKIIQASAGLIIDMNSTELSLDWKKCSNHPTDRNDYMIYVDDMPFSMFYLKGETDLDPIGYELVEDDPDIDTIINSANYIFQLLLNSISFSVSSTIVLGIKNMLVLQKYKSGVQLSDLCKIQKNIWDSDLDYLKPYVPTDVNIKSTPQWIKPRYDKLNDTIVRDYVYPIYVNEKYYGLYVLTINYEEMFRNITLTHDPSEAYHFVVGATDAVVYSASKNMVRLLFDNDNTVIEQFQTEFNSLANSTTGFQYAIQVFLNDNKMETELDCNVDNNRYYITGILELEYDFAMITVIPTSNLYGAKWRLFPETVMFYYSDINEKPTSEITIVNEGKYKATFSLESNFRLNVSQFIGIEIEPYENKTITLELDINKLEKMYGLYLLIEPNGTNSECYTTIVSGISIMDISCTMNHLTYDIEECDGTNQYLNFKWSNESECEGGIDLPSRMRITCQWMDHDIGFKTFTIIIEALYLVIVLFIIINTFRHYTQLRGIIIPIFLYTYIVGLLLRQIALIFFTFTHLNERNCNTFQILDSLGTVTMCCSITVTLRQGYIKYIKKQIIRIHEYYYLVLHLLPFVILITIVLIFTNPFYDSWTVQQDYGMEVTIDTCLSSNFLKKLFVDLPVYLLILINLFYGMLLLINRKGLGVTIVQFSRGANCATVCLLAHPLLKYLTKNGYPNMTDIGYCYAVELLILSIYQLWFIPVRQWICCKNTDISPEYKILFMQLLNDPISRHYLKEHMKTLRQEENVIFWEAVNELRKNEVEEPHLTLCVKHIYERFINDKGDLEININDAMKKRITDEIEKGNTDLSVYDEAMKEIEQLIYVNAYHTYSASSDCESANTLLSWYRNFENLSDRLQSSVYRKILQDKPYLSPFFIDGFEKLPNWQKSSGFNILSPFQTLTTQSVRTTTQFKFVTSNNNSRNASVVQSILVSGDEKLAATKSISGVAINSQQFGDGKSKSQAYDTKLKSQVPFGDSKSKSQAPYNDTKPKSRSNSKSSLHVIPIKVNSPGMVVDERIDRN